MNTQQYLQQYVPGPVRIFSKDENEWREKQENQRLNHTLGAILRNRGYDPMNVTHLAKTRESVTSEALDWLP